MKTNKPKLLVYSDFVLAGTGFGTVSKYVVTALQEYFDIDQLAINHSGEFFDNSKLPIQVVPAKLLNPQDPYGSQMFVNSIQTGKYDYVWIMNDTFVVEKVAKELPKLIEILRTNKQKVPTIIYYYPIDCKVLPEATTMIRVADHVVAYCEFGKEETLKVIPEVVNKLSVINHGVDTKSFHKLSSIDRKIAREHFLKVKDDNTFVWINVNRNTPRKDIPKTILAFKEFKNRVPNSKLYLHTAIKDTTIDLGVTVKDIGLSLQDVIFPANYAAHKPFPLEVLNTLYNCGDAFITTALGGGWELSTPDASAIGIPVVVPENTCFVEQYTDRGYIYPCKELTWIDNSGFRKIGHLNDIVETMMTCYKDIQSGVAKEKAALAKQWVDSITWEKIGNQWVELFQTLANRPKQVQIISGTTL